MKRILLLFSTLMLSISALWAHDVKIDGIYYNLDETNKTAEVTYKGVIPGDANEYYGSIVIPSSIVYNSETYNVTSIGEHAFYNCSSLINIVIPEGVTSIGENAFKLCENLKNFEDEYLPNTVPVIPNPSADSVTIAIHVPKETCNGVILVGAGVGPDGTDDWSPGYKNNPFKQLEGEEGWYTITIGYENYLRVKAIALTEDGNADWSTQWGKNSDWEENVVILDGTATIDNSEYGGDVSLTTFEKGGVVLVLIKKWQSSPCVVRNEAGTATFTLKSPTLPEGATVGIIGKLNDEQDWNISAPVVMTQIDNNTYTATVTVGEACEYKYVFSLDGGLTWDWSKSEYGANRYMPLDLKPIDIIEEWNGLPNTEDDLNEETRSLTINYDEYEVDSVLVIPNSVKEIGRGAFRECSNLAYISMGDNITSIGEEAFYNTKMYNSKSYWDEGVLYIGNYLINTSNNEIEREYSIKEGTILIADNAFDHCYNMTSVIIPNSVKYIGASSFIGCTNLTKVNYLGTIDEWVGIDFSESFSNPTYYYKDLYINNELLTDIKILEASSIKNYAFVNCSSIKSLELGSNVSSIGDYAFYGCYNLKKITAYPTSIPYINIDSKNYLFGTYIAKLYVPCEALEDYELDNAFGQFKYIRCIEEEEEAPEDVEIEVDDNGNVNIKWPPTEGANSYKLVVSHAGNVICTLQFNSMGQLTSIDLGKRSASVGFEFTVTGLSQGSKYSYEMTALSEVNEVLDYYAGAFITNGYKEDDDVTTSINESITDANITVSGGTISADADFSIYNTIGQNVTAQNGSLQPGVYLVSIENDIVKVMIK